MDEVKVVTVAVATLWTKPQLPPRPVDTPVLGNPVDMEAWLEGLDYEKRLACCTDHLIQSQLLYGEKVLVLEETGDWARVVVPGQPCSKDERGYPGWIPKVQLGDVVAAGSEQQAIVVKAFAPLYEKKDEEVLKLSFQTWLPVASIDGEWVEVATPHGSRWLRSEDVEVIEHDSLRGGGKEVVCAAEMFLDLPYLWGGMSAYGYDCSGLAYNMVRSIGVIIPRDASDQIKVGKHVEEADVQPGDLLFFAYEEGKGAVHHVGIYHGDGKMIHSPKTGRTVEIIDLAGTIYEKELCGIRRYWD